MPRKKVNVKERALVEDEQPTVPFGAVAPATTEVDEGQARADRATHIMLMQAFWPEYLKGQGGPRPL